MLKKILLTLTLMIVMVAQAFATDSELGDKTTTSQPYVKTQVDLKQGLIPAAGTNSALGESVVTYTSNGGGEIGERGIYSDPSSYDASADADKLITASALNTAFTTLPTTDTTTLECANPGTCTLWTIVDQTAYGESITLPAGYTRLAYIESTGTQYIDTGIKPTAQTSVSVKASLLNLTGGPSFCGSLSSSQGILIGTGSDGTGAFYANATTPAVSGVIIEPGSIYEISVGGTTVSVQKSGEPAQTYTASAVIPTNYNIYMIGRNNAGSAQRLGPFYYYYMKIYENGILVRDFVPAKYGNEVGMYDTVSRAFFRNAGSGTFGAGPVVD